MGEKVPRLYTHSHDYVSRSTPLDELMLYNT
jgi:hypothetical protein